MKVKYFIVVVFQLLVSIMIVSFSNAQTQTGLVRIQKATNGPTINVYALVVGISKYKNIDGLRFADVDAMAFANFLKSPNIKTVKLIEFYNQDATKANIVEQGFGTFDLMVSRNEIKENDLIIIYLSGHGGAYNVNDSFFFPYDALSMQDGGSSVSIFDIKSDIGKWVNKNRKVILVFDACRSSTIPGMPPDAIKKVSELLEKPNGSMLFAASSGGNEALEFPKLEHGIFTYYFLRGLYGEADTGKKDGTVTARELGNYIYDSVATKSNQQPKLDYANQENFPMATVNKAMMSKVKKSIEPRQVYAEYTARGAKVSTGKPGDKSIEELEKSFRESLKQNKLVRPANDCAYFYYREMERKAPDAQQLIASQTSLISAVYESARKVLENDLKGLRQYQRPSKDTLKSSGYDLFYYADPLQSMEVYQNLKKESGKDNAEKMAAYFKGRQEWLLYESEEDSVNYMPHLLQSIKIFSEAAVKYPNEPYILEGYAESLTEYISEYIKEQRQGLTEVKKTKELLDNVMRLAPKWSYPYATLGDLYFYLGDNVSENKWNLEAIKVNKGDPYPYLNLGDIYYRRDENVKARGYYEKAYALDSTMTITLQYIGDTYFEENDVKNGSKYYEKLLRLDPKFVDARIDYGDYLVENDMEKEAIKQYQYVLKIDPKNEMAWYSLADAQNTLEENDEALISIKKAIALKPEDYYNQLLLGQILWDQGNLKESRKVYESLAAKFPKKGGPYSELADNYKEAENYDEAKGYYRKAFAADPKVVYLKDLIDVFEDQDQTDSVIAVHRQIIAFAPKEPGNYNALGIVYYNQKNYPEAIKYFGEAVRVDPKYHFGYYNQGLSFDALNDEDQALAMFRKTNEVNPAYMQGFYRLGLVLMKREEFKNAITAFQSGIKADLSYPENYYQIGFISARYLKNSATANEYLQKAIAAYLKKASADPKDALNLAYAADCYYLMGDGNKALEYLDKAEMIDPKNSYAHAKRGYVYLKQNKMPEAEVEFKKALELAPESERRMYSMACFYAINGNKEQALSWLKKALEKGYNDFVNLKYNADIASIRDTEEFKSLVSQYNRAIKK